MKNRVKQSTRCGDMSTTYTCPPSSDDSQAGWSFVHVVPSIPMSTMFPLDIISFECFDVPNGLLYVNKNRASL
jgi:hypothetical protein